MGEGPLPHDGVNRMSFTNELTDVPAPIAAVPSLGNTTGMPTALRPEQIIYFYSPDEWEVFVREWASALQNDYFQVKRHGGANDRGVDVLGLLTSAGVTGEWDCYQCKHYASPLGAADAFAEMLKIFHGVVDQAYTFPRKYRFLAPRGCIRSLDKLFDNPDQLKDKFLDWLQKSTCPVNALPSDTQGQITQLAQMADYSIFKSEQLQDVLEVHSSTDHHVLRFGTLMRRRENVTVPPTDVLDGEAVYIQKLVDIYNEKNASSWTTAAEVSADKWSENHLLRQREAFFSAEDLRVQAREQVPERIYESFKQDVYDSVVEMEQALHASGLARLTTVLTTAASLVLPSNAIMVISKPRDLKGLCHHLANENRLTWSGEESSP